MSSASYRLESFRLWNPAQGDAQPSWSPLDTCRYPSSISITITPSPSNTRDPPSESQKIDSPRPERHPLHVRPPAEVCLYGGSQPDTQIARHEPEVLGPSSSINPDIETVSKTHADLVSDLVSGYLDWPRQYIDKFGSFPILSKYSHRCERKSSLFQLHHSRGPIPSSNKCRFASKDKYLCDLGAREVHNEAISPYLQAIAGRATIFPL